MRADSRQGKMYGKCWWQAQMVISKQVMIGKMSSKGDEVQQYDELEWQ